MRHSRPENICIKLHRACPGFHRNPQLVLDRRKKICVAIILLLGLCWAGSDWLKRCGTATLLILCESVKQLVYKLDAHTHILSNPVHFHLHSNLLLNKRKAAAVQLQINGLSSISNHLINDTAWPNLTIWTGYSAQVGSLPINHAYKMTWHLTSFIQY